MRARRVAVTLFVCACVACVGAVLLGLHARREYRRAVALPGQRVTAAEKLERLAVRMVGGVERTYASRPRYVLVSIITFGRAALHAMAAWGLWNLVRHGLLRASIIKATAVALLATTPLAVVAWFLFVRNLSAVKDSFDLLGDRLGLGSAVFLASFVGVLFSTGYAVAALLLTRPEPPVARLIDPA